MRRISRFSNRLKEYRDVHDLTLADLEKITNVPAQTLNRYELDQRTPKVDIAIGIAESLNISALWLQGFDVSMERDAEIFRQDNIIPYVPGRRLPIIGSIPAGLPVLSEQNIEGYDYADVPENEDYFFLRVQGDSMINARIFDGDLVLIKMQPCAENGQIVACIINGDEATLKRFNQQKEMVILQPENSAYQPIIVSCKDFENGYARIIGVAKRVLHNL